MGIFAIVCILVCFLINPFLGILVAILVIGCMLVPKPKNDARSRNNWDD